MIAYLLVGLTILVGASHYWQAITISPPDSGERLNASLLLVFFACLIPFGYRFARITIGVLFLFFAFINLLAILAYVRDFSGDSLQFLFLTLVLGTLGCLLLSLQSVRVFEEERGKQQLANR